MFVVDTAVNVVDVFSSLYVERVGPSELALAAMVPYTEMDVPATQV